MHLSPSEWLVVAVGFGAAGGVTGAYLFHRVGRLLDTPRGQSSRHGSGLSPRCRQCGAPIGGGHTGYCPKSAMMGGSGMVVMEDVDVPPENVQIGNMPAAHAPLPGDEDEAY